MKPFGSGFYIRGLSVIGNVFKSLNGAITRVDGVDTSFADFNYGLMRNILFEGNSFDGVTIYTQNPLKLTHTEASENVHWNVEFAPRLPFGGLVRQLEGLVSVGSITDTTNTRVVDFPYILTGQGAGGSQVRVTWPTAAKGKIAITARMDRPD